MEHEPYLQEIKETIEQIRSLLPERGHYSTQQRILNLIDKVGSAAKIYAKPEIFNLGEALAAMVQTKGTGGAAPIISRKKGLELFDLVLLYWEEFLNVTADNSGSASVGRLLAALNQASSGIDPDLSSVYYHDILKKKLPDPQRQDLGHFNDDYTVGMNLNMIDDIIMKVNNLIVTQYQLKRKIEKISDYSLRMRQILDNPGAEMEDIRQEQKQFAAVERDISSSLLVLETNSTRLQGSILGLRMVPLELLTGEIEQEMEKVAARIGNKARCEVDTQTIRVDKVILESLRSALLAAVVNALEHGIELSDTRKQLDKNPVGLVQIRAEEKNELVTIILDDDGQGIDYEKAAHSALHFFPHRQREIDARAVDELNELLFSPGVGSTGAADRGFGLAEARNQLGVIGGTISIHSVKGKGTSCRIIIPKSLTTISGYFVMAAGRKLFLPSMNISEIIIVDPAEVLDMDTYEAVRIRQMIIPIYPLNGILHSATRLHNEKLFILIAEHQGVSIGIMADEILYHTSTMYKLLPGLISSINGVQGIVFDENFSIIPILNVPVIMDILKNTKNTEYRNRYSQDDVRYASVLIVDDSENARDIHSVMLERNRIASETAIDGIDALTKLKNKAFQLIITDTEMPRMDGLTFIENCRKISGYEKTPIMVLSSDAGSAGKQRYLDAGAQSYHYKSSFDRDQFALEILELLGIHHG